VAEESGFSLHPTKKALIIKKANRCLNFIIWENSDFSEKYKKTKDKTLRKRYRY
jgi:hypothetical protein